MRLVAAQIVYDSEWRNGRVVEGAGLENRCTRKGTGGSNPSSSARINNL